VVPTTRYEHGVDVYTLLVSLDQSRAINYYGLLLAQEETGNAKG